MAFNILTIRDREAGDGRLYPVMGDDRSPVELEELDGEILTVTATAVSVAAISEGKFNQLIRCNEIKADILITDARVVVACDKYEKGGGWVGLGGPGAVVMSLGLNAVSKARAAHRRHGKMLLGQVRHQWLQQVGSTPKAGFGTNERVRLRLSENTSGTSRDLVLDLTLPRNISAAEVARAIGSKAARFRLDHTDLAEDMRARFEALVTAAPLVGAPKKFVFHPMPNHYPANSRTAELARSAANTVGGTS